MCDLLRLLEDITKRELHIRMQQSCKWGEVLLTRFLRGRGWSMGHFLFWCVSVMGFSNETPLSALHHHHHHLLRKPKCSRTPHLKDLGNLKLWALYIPFNPLSNYALASSLASWPSLWRSHPANQSSEKRVWFGLLTVLRSWTWVTRWAAWPHLLVCGTGERHEGMRSIYDDSDENTSHVMRWCGYVMQHDWSVCSAASHLQLLLLLQGNLLSRYRVNINT